MFVVGSKGISKAEAAGRRIKACFSKGNAQGAVLASCAHRVVAIPGSQGHIGPVNKDIKAFGKLVCCADADLVSEPFFAS